jgi:amidase
MTQTVATSAVEVEKPKPTTKYSWQARVAAKQAEVKAGIPPAWLIPPSILAAIPLSPTSNTDLTKTNIVRECGFLSERELDLTEKYNARQLLRKMAVGEVTSLEVAVAFSKRPAVAQQLVCPLLDMSLSVCS